MLDIFNSLLNYILKSEKSIFYVPGFRKGKKIARWLTSHLSKDSDRALRDKPPETEVRLHVNQMSVYSFR